MPSYGHEDPKVHFDDTVHFLQNPSESVNIIDFTKLDKSIRRTGPPRQRCLLDAKLNLDGTIVQFSWRGWNNQNIDVDPFRRRVKTDDIVDVKVPSWTFINGSYKGQNSLHVVKKIHFVK